MVGKVNLFAREAKDCQKNWDKGNRLSVPYYQNWGEPLATWNYNVLYANSFAALCHRTFDPTKWCDYPVFVEKRPLDSPFIFANLLIPIEDKPLYEVALACGEQYMRKDATQRNLFLEQCGLALRTATELIKDRLTFAKQMLRTQLIKDLYDDTEVLASAYVRLFVFLSEADEDFASYLNAHPDAYPGMTPQTLEALRDAIICNNYEEDEDRFKNFLKRYRGEEGDESDEYYTPFFPTKPLFIPEVFRYVLAQEAPRLKTANLLQQHDLLLETLVGQTSHAVGDSLLRCESVCRNPPYFESKLTSMFVTRDQFRAYANTPPAG
jgi:hypothetical protein